MGHSRTEIPLTLQISQRQIPPTINLEQLITELLFTALDLHPHFFSEKKNTSCSYLLQSETIQL